MSPVPGLKNNKYLHTPSAGPWFPVVNHKNDKHSYMFTISLVLSVMMEQHRRIWLILLFILSFDVLIYSTAAFLCIEPVHESFSLSRLWILVLCQIKSFHISGKDWYILMPSYIYEWLYFNHKWLTLLSFGISYIDRWISFNVQSPKWIVLISLNCSYCILIRWIVYIFQSYLWWGKIIVPGWLISSIWIFLWIMLHIIIWRLYYTE